jgi:hypothetical protein
MDNMSFLNRLTLALFAKVYESFPTPVDLDIKSIAMDVIPQDAGETTTWDCLQAAEDAVDFSPSGPFRNGSKVAAHPRAPPRRSSVSRSGIRKSSVTCWRSGGIWRCRTGSLECRHRRCAAFERSAPPSSPGCWPH